MSRKEPPLSDEAREWFRRQGRKGGKLGGHKGGKAALVKMTKAARIARARMGGLAASEARKPAVMERARKVAQLREAGKPMTEIADELGISISQTYKLARLAAGEGL